MADVLSRKQRQYNMSRIRGRDTKPELILRRGLHSRGLRFRLHRRDLPGKPDIVFPKYRVAVFVHGCFWHAHDCPRFKWPQTRATFWRAKIASNRERDRRNLHLLDSLGWRVLTVWECAIVGPNRMSMHDLLDSCAEFFCHSECPCDEVAGIINQPRQ